MRSGRKTGADSWRQRQPGLTTKGFAPRARPGREQPLCKPVSLTSLSPAHFTGEDVDAQISAPCPRPCGRAGTRSSKALGSGVKYFFWGSLRCLALRAEDWASQNSTGGRRAGSREAGRGAGPRDGAPQACVAGAPTQSKVRKAALWTHRLPPSHGEAVFCSRPPGSEPSLEAGRGEGGVCFSEILGTPHTLVLNTPSAGPPRVLDVAPPSLLSQSTIRKAQRG